MIQRALTGLGKRPGPVDGLFGPLTEAGVVRFQRSAGIAADGVVGRQTARQLLAATRPADTRLARQPGGNADRSGRFVSARMRRDAAVEVARKAGLGGSVSQAGRAGRGGRRRSPSHAGAGAASAAGLGAARCAAGTRDARTHRAKRNHHPIPDRSGARPVAAVDDRMHRGHTTRGRPSPSSVNGAGDRVCDRRPAGTVEESGVRDQMAAIAELCAARLGSAGDRPRCGTRRRPGPRAARTGPRPQTHGGR